VLAAVSEFLQDAPSHRVEVQADVTTSAPDRWTVHVATDVDGTPGERLLEADSCAALASATALIVAWTNEPRGPRSQAPEPVPSPSPVPRSASAAAPARSSASGVTGVLAVAAQGDLGTFPREDLAAEVTVGATLRRLRVEVSGSLWLPEDTTKNPGEGAHLHLLEGGARGCWRDVVGRSLELDPCLGAGVVHVSSAGFGESNQYQRDAWLGLARGDFLATWTFFEPLALRALIGMAVPLARPPVVILEPQGGSSQLYRPSVVAGRLELGVQVHFP
jgi:hypothetical protein